MTVDKALQAKWEKVLEAENMPAEIPLGVVYNHPERADYSDMAMQFLRTHRFRTPEERRLWAWHAQGYSLREISIKSGRCRKFVTARITKLREEMQNGPDSTNSR